MTTPFADAMSQLAIYDSMTGGKRQFVPLKAGQVGMYVCGMTVYDYCHIGHARVMVALIWLFAGLHNWVMTSIMCVILPISMTKLSHVLPKTVKRLVR